MPIKECHFPNCRHISKHTWATVHLCDFHYETIKTEADDHYKGGKNSLSYEDRYYYLQIAPMIPWSRESERRRMS